MSSPSSPWTCPWCPLLCDDAPVPEALDCALAQARLAEHRQTGAPPEALPRVDGQAVPLDTALDTAATRLAAARLPLLAGLGVDVAGARALAPLADVLGAAVDAWGGQALGQALRAQQDRGGYTATLAELHERAELLVFVGSWAPERAPRLIERVAAGRTEAPQLVALGVEAPASAGGVAVRSLPLQHDLPRTLALLSLCVRERAPAGTEPALLDLADRLRNARYSVLVWEPAQLGPQAGLLIERLQQIIGLLNQRTRAAGFPLGGGDGAATAAQVFAWSTGLPMRSRLGPRGREHDPILLPGERLLDEGGVDALLWVNAFGSPPPATRWPRVVLATASCAAACQDAGTVYLPVATPGLEHDAHLFRTDGVVLMPLRAAQPQSLPSVATLARALYERLARLRAPLPESVTP